MMEMLAMGREGNGIHRRSRGRSIAYWTICIFFLVEIGASALVIQDYFDDPQTYHQVYSDAVQVIALNLFFGPLGVVALAYHVAGWRERRFSPFVLAVLVLNFGFAIVDHIFNITVICCI
jgi:hypothetical protein